MCYKLNTVRAPKCGRRKCVSHVFRVFLWWMDKCLYRIMFITGCAREIICFLRAQTIPRRFSHFLRKTMTMILLILLIFFLLPSDSLWFRCKIHASHWILSSVLWLAGCVTSEIETNEEKNSISRYRFLLWISSLYLANVTASPKISSGLAVTNISLELALCVTKQSFFNLLQICC